MQYCASIINYLQKGYETWVGEDVLKPIISLFTIKTKSAASARYYALQGRNTEHLT